MDTNQFLVMNSVHMHLSKTKNCVYAHMEPILYFVRRQQKYSAIFRHKTLLSSGKYEKEMFCSFCVHAAYIHFIHPHGETVKYTSQYHAF